MPKRQINFPEGEFFHICNKSIANYKIFRHEDAIERFILALDYYNNLKNPRSLSDFLKLNKNVATPNLLSPKADRVVKILSYCVMPDHYHLLVKTLSSDVVSKYIGTVENSYSKYFNLKYRRKGPLWQSRFRVVHITSNEQLLHVCRYIHLNPTTKRLVEKPEQWNYSSYRDFITDPAVLNHYLKEISINTPPQYKKFVEDQIDYQRSLDKIKHLLLD